MKGQEHWLTEGDEQWLKDSLMQLVMSKVPRAPAIVKAMPHGTTPAACYAPQLRVLFARSINWEVPISEIDKVSRGRPLSTIVMWVGSFTPYNLLGLSEPSLRGINLSELSSLSIATRFSYAWH